MLGLKLAAIYGYPPSRLGFCGEGSDKNLTIIKKFLNGNDDLVDKVRQILSTFEAAYSYYQLIAKKNNIKDPFDKKVVEAYWLGNDLLEKIKLNDLKQMIRSDFVRPNLLTKEQAEEKIGQLKEGVLPNHLFHVLFIGSITGRVKLQGQLIDICRIGWGKVKEVKEKSVVVFYEPLILDSEGKYKLGEAEDKAFIWDKDFLEKPEKNDLITFHWGRLCQRINKEEKEKLEYYTKLVAGSFNAQHK